MIPAMLITLVCIYMAVWCCAYAAARVYTGRAGFILLYLVAVIVGPAVFGLIFGAIFARVDPQHGNDLTGFTILVGAGLALMSYPLSYWRQRRQAPGNQRRW